MFSVRVLLYHTFWDIILLPKRIVSAIVAFSWVGTLMLMLLIPSAAKWVLSLFISAITSPVRVIRPTLATWLGQNCCRSWDPVDHIFAVNKAGFSL